MVVNWQRCGVVMTTSWNLCIQCLNLVLEGHESGINGRGSPPYRFGLVEISTYDNSVIAFLILVLFRPLRPRQKKHYFWSHQQAQPPASPARRRVELAQQRHTYYSTRPQQPGGRLRCLPCALECYFAAQASVYFSRIGRNWGPKLGVRCCIFYSVNKAHYKM